MADKKVYEIEATIMLRQNFEVDATNRSNAYDIAEQELEKIMTFIKRDCYESYDIDIEQVEESEGH